MPNATYPHLVLAAAVALGTSCNTDSAPAPMVDGAEPGDSHAGDGGTGDPAEGDGLAGDQGVGDAMVALDVDQDGLEDAWEMEVARDYLPYLALHPEDECAVGGILFRLRPHPNDTTRVHIIYDHLFAEDCGLNAHPGDNETFSMTVNPNLPPPEGIEAITTVAHQGAPVCEDESNCGTCGGLDACTTTEHEGADWPVVFYGKNKHGTFLSVSGCLVGACLDACVMADAPTARALLNVGEPDFPLVSDLTTQGFVRPAEGWTDPSLWNIDPWAAGVQFGGAGFIRDDFLDPTFDTPVCP